MLDKACARIAVASSVLSVLFLPTGLSAQQAGPVDGVRAAGTLEEVVVTARKREESLQDVPVLVTALSQDQIDRYDITSLEKVAAATPQFNVGRASNGSGAQLTLRGIGSSSTSIGIEQSVAVVVDGVYYGQGRIINEGFFDLQRVELLKGPQALFFGKNATAGVISISSADPTPELELMVRAGYEFEAEEVVGEVVASGPISDTLGFRVAIRGSNMFGGYYDNKAQPISYGTFDFGALAPSTFTMPPSAAEQPGKEEVLGRLTLQWTPNERLTARVKTSATYNEVNNSSWNYVLFNCNGGVSTLNPAVPCGFEFDVFQNDIAPEIAADMPFARDGELYNRYRSHAVTGLVDYALDDMVFTMVLNYQYNKNTWLCACDFQSSNTGTWATENSTWDAFSSELRLLTDYDGPLNAMIGFYYQNTNRDFDQFIAFAGLENSLAAPENRFLAVSKNSGTDGETLAGFAQLVWDFLSDWELAGGVRYTHETKDSFFRHPYVHFFIAPGGGLPIFVPDQTIIGNQTFDNWAPEATLTWRPMDDLTVYAAYKTAYKSGGFSISGLLGTATTVDDFAFDPEKAKGFEGGFKADLLNRSLRLNFGAYTYKYTNLQVDFFNSPTFAFITTNAGSARTKGVEIDFEWVPPRTEGLSLRGSLNYNDANYLDFIAPCYSGQTPAAGCTLLGPAPALTPLQDLRGAPLAVAPEWTGSLGGSYERSINARLSMDLSVDARYSDSYLASGFGNPASRQDDYVNVDAALRVRTTDERWELAVIGRNLTNEVYVSGVVDGPSTGGGTGTAGGFLADQIGFGNVPRTVLMQLTWRY